MARMIARDFEALKEYLESYTLNAVINNPRQLDVIKTAHKGYLPFLQFWSVCLDAANNNTFSIFGKRIDVSSQEFAHFREAVSDVGNGLFCCLHGAYKSGHMALRSSIENYLRFATGPFDKSGLSTTSVYELFDIAKTTHPFIDRRTAYLEQLRNIYVELCKFTHSATLEHMAGIHALAHFPSFDENAFRKWLIFKKKCMGVMTTVTLLGQPSLYLNSHFTAKEVIDLLFSHSERLEMLKGKSSLIEKVSSID